MRVHEGLKDIPSEYFPVWDETMGYERGLPHFRQPSEFAEEGILIPTVAGYTYQQLHRQMTPSIPPSSRLSPSPTMQVEVEDNISTPTALPPFRNEHEIGDPSYPALWSETAWTSAQSDSGDEVWYQPSGEGSSSGAHIPFNLPHHHNTFYDEQPLSPLYEVPADLEEDMYLQTIFPQSMDIASASTSAPRSIQWDSLGHDRSTISPQLDDQMTDSFGLVPYSTLPYGINTQH